MVQENISTVTVVWVANRETPLEDSSGVLKVSDHGFLILVNHTGAIFWSSNSSIASKNPVAQLLESGNLVMKFQDDSNPENFLWQSFDYPCDTLLPGMKLGRNTVTGLNRYLTSWKSNDDPSRGNFTFGLDPHGVAQLVLMKGSVEQFRTGVWNGLRFSGMPYLKSNFFDGIYTMSFVFNQEEIYHSFEVLKSSIVARIGLSQTGLVQRFIWIDRTHNWNVYLTAQTDNCDSYALCGAYASCRIGNIPVCECLKGFVPKFQREWDLADWSNGCVRRTPLDCPSGDAFVKLSGIKLPDTRYFWFDKMMTLEECKVTCLKNCSCMAYANLDIRDGGSGCLLWFDDPIDIKELTDNGQDLYIRMSSSELGQVSSNRKKRKKIIVISTLLTGIFLMGMGLIFHVLKKRNKLASKGPKEKIGDNAERGYTNGSQKDDLELPFFDLVTITNATNNFSGDNKLGEGGFGPVYKGVLEEGQDIAVKRLSRNSKQGFDEFKNEVIFIAKLQHRNLVKLLGCCIEGEEKMLIYEYMPNKSLDFFIFDQTRSILLDWPKRFHIISGIARGLLYLHQDSRLRIIHRDLKVSNILLDKEMNPKISDFGLARSFGENETQANTKRVVGTYGYMSPEYAIDGLFSVKSDVFSFGVLVLEMVTGKRNRGFCHPDHHLNLLGHVWRIYKEGRSLELIDASIDKSRNLSELLRSIHVALLCVQQSPEDRPDMLTVVLMLSGEGSLPQPKQPGFFTERNLLKADALPNNDGPCSANMVTVTMLEAR
uniref:Receptor-like serine/threonine-protein kinase n=1 Tax=Davidia involucrata TaxID=16924 RepID=A0A5B6Z6H6_DAVIN